jgi:hypothetical protein
MEQMLIVDRVNGTPNFLRRAGGVDLAVGMLHAGHADRGERHRHRDVLAGHGRRHGTVVDVAGDALAQLVLFEGVGVVAVGRFRPRARIRIVVEHARHAPARDLLQIVDVGNLVEIHACPFPGRCVSPVIAVTQSEEKTANAR